jgi:membrane protein
LKPYALGQKLWKEFNDDEVTTRAASLAYYFLLAVFPAMLFLLSMLGYFAAFGSQIRDNLFQLLARVLPASAGELVQKTIEEIIKANGAGKAIFGVVGALWAASSGVGAIMQCLNVAYDVEETRPWWKKPIISVGLTIALSVLIISAITLVLYGGQLAQLVAKHVGFGTVFVTGWKIAQWPIALGFMFLAFAVVYYFAPNVKAPEWHWITPGSGLGVIVWLGASFGLRIYLHYFNSYSKSYGSLGAVIILLLWLYLTGIAIMVGGEVNSIIAHEDAVVRSGAKPEKVRETHPKIAA